MERWRMGDPFLVYSRIEQQEQRRRERSKQTKQEAALRGLEQLFTGDGMGRKLNVSPGITAAMRQWGEWANRKQYWVNLNVTPFCKLMGIGFGRAMPEIRLDPQSMAIHKAVMRMQCKKTQIVLVGYYVGRYSWDDRPDVYAEHAKIPRKTFYELLRLGSESAFNAAKL